MTTFQSPIKSGTVKDGLVALTSATTGLTGAYNGCDLGYAVLQQSGTLSFGATLVQDLRFNLPANARIIDIIVDVLTVYDSATSATVSVGRTTGATQLASGVDAKTSAVRIRPTFTAAQLLAMDNITTNTTVIATCTSVGQPTAGSTRVTIVYVAQ